MVNDFPQMQCEGVLGESHPYDVDVDVNDNDNDLYAQIYTKASNGICKCTDILPRTKTGSICKKETNSLYIVLT